MKPGDKLLTVTEIIYIIFHKKGTAEYNEKSIRFNCKILRQKYT